MPHTYGLYPWTWNAGESCHEPPAGAFAVLDLRPEAEQARAGQSSGWGFFAWPDIVPGNGPNISAPADAVTLGYGDCRELLPDTATRDELRIKLGLSTNPGGTTLIDCIGDVLGSLSDPTGQSGPKPLLPTREGLLEIHLSNHSRVFSEAFDAGPMFGSSATGKQNRIRDVVRTDLETANKSGGPALVAKVLGGLLDRWGIDYAQAAKWRNLIRAPLLAELLGKSGGKFNPRKPQTSYADAFTRADGSLGASWATSTASGVSWSVASNAAQCFYDNPTATTASDNFARYESDVSSSDHWCDLTATTRTGGATANHINAPLCRYSSAANTAYGHSKSYSTSSVSSSVIKIVSGTVSTLGSSTGFVGVGQRRIIASGSTITGEAPTGTNKVSVTDTSITGNTRGGMLSRYTTTIASDLTQVMDDWSVDDGVAAASSINGLLLMGCGT